jgi:hypothetical protein
MAFVSQLVLATTIFVCGACWYVGTGVLVAVAFWRSARTPDADGGWPPDWLAISTVLLWPLALVFLTASLVIGFFGGIVRGSMK